MGQPSKSQAHRRETDTSLRAERSKIDDELATRRSASQRSADEVVRIARKRADSALREARRRDDRSDVSEARKRELASKRAREDLILTTERAIADQHLELDRKERERALVAHFRAERYTTDERLGAERRRSDQLIDARDEFLGMVSHDLRSMLGGITLNAERLSSQRSHDEVVLDHARRIQRFAVRMERLIGDLLDVVSLDAGKLEVRPEIRDPRQVVREADESFRAAFAAAGIELETRIASHSSMVELDRDRIHQVLSNLLTNAMKFTPRGGRVTLSVGPVDGQVRFSVIDTGPGIPADKRTSIFERFDQGTAEDRRGHGLGLYIAKRIVEAHGGKIWIEPAPEGGTAIHFTLPAVSREAA